MRPDFFDNLVKVVKKAFLYLSGSIAIWGIVVVAVTTGIGNDSIFMFILKASVLASVIAFAICLQAVLSKARPEIIGEYSKKLFKYSFYTVLALVVLGVFYIIFYN